jgi:catechol 2,3-dioxygenase
MSNVLRPHLTHAGIYVRDLGKMVRFYTEVMDLVESDRGTATSFPIDVVFLTADPTKHHQLVLATGREETGASTVNQLSFSVSSLDELRDRYNRLKAHGIDSIRAVDHGNAWSLYFPDPEGNFVELYLDTPWYVAQPHANPLDLTLSNDDIYARTESNCRQDQTFISQAEWQQRIAKALQERKQ